MNWNLNKINSVISFIKEINIKNIKAFFQGHFRSKFIKYFKDKLEYVEEIFLYRKYQVLKNSPQCINSGSCVVCGCKTPELLYANKGCKGGCYGDMQTKAEWTTLKNRGLDIDKLKKDVRKLEFEKSINQEQEIDVLFYE